MMNKRVTSTVVACLVGLFTLASCSTKEDPAPPTVAERLALARQDSVKYVDKEQCHPITTWPVVIPAESIPQPWPLRQNVLEDLLRLGLISRSDKLVDAKTVDGHPFKRPMLVYQLTARARPFMRASVGPDGVPKTALCFGRLVWEDSRLEILPYLEPVGENYARETITHRHYALPTEDGKGVVSWFEYSLTPDQSPDAWAHDVVDKLGGDAQFLREHKKDLDGLWFQVYVDTNRVNVTVENRGSGWHVVDSAFAKRRQ